MFYQNQSEVIREYNVMFTIDDNALRNRKEGELRLLNNMKGSWASYTSNKMKLVKEEYTFQSRPYIHVHPIYR